VGDLVQIQFDATTPILNINNPVEIINILTQTSFRISGDELNEEEFIEFDVQNAIRTGIVSKVDDTNGTNNGLLYQYYYQKSINNKDCFDKNI
jgi:hypothetical protein